MNRLQAPLAFAICAIGLSTLAIATAKAVEVKTAASGPFAELEQQFRTMPMAARRLTGPLFWMHGDETPAQLTGELQRVLEGHNGTFTTEPRPHKDWLGEGWYRDLALCLDFARKNDLTLFIYDDWWWPSQMMGGRVPAKYGSKRLVATATAVEGPKGFKAEGYGDANLIRVIAGKLTEANTVDGQSLVDLTQKVSQATLTWDVPAGKWQIMKFSWKFNGNQGGQQRYISVDGASPDCVDWFIKTVYQPHYDRFKADFGKTIVGYFYDEPETQGDWGSDVPKVIAERKLDLARLLVAYKFKLAGDEQPAALFSYLDCFADAWGRTMYGGMSRWCREHKVVSMGHFMEHGNDMFSQQLSGGNMMQLQKYSDMGGIDLVCNQLHPGQRDAGHYHMPKIASSISHVYNKDNDIAFCEIYGGYGQVLTYPEMKWLADWHQVRGVNYLIPHSFNPRAPFDSDFPPYFYNGGFEPRWPLYRVWADYTNRLSLMLTGGRHVCPVAFLHLGQSFHVGQKLRPEEMTTALQDAQFDCDWLPYDAWEDTAQLEGAKITLHKEDYRVLVMPAVEVIPYATLAKARQFFDNGGTVVAYGMLPSKSATLGRSAKDIAELCQAVWGQATPGLACCKTNATGGRSYFLPGQVTAEDIQKVLVSDAKIHPTLEISGGASGRWLHVLHRQKEGRDVFLVCNQNHLGKASAFELKVTAAGEPECWDAMRNEISVPRFRRIDAKTIAVSLTLEPSESTLLVLQTEARKLPQRIETRSAKAAQTIPLVRHAVKAAVTQPKAASSEPFPLERCVWVWHPEGGSGVDAPVAKRYFRGSLVIPEDRKIKAARFVLSADNELTLWVNGERLASRIGDGEAWRSPLTVDLTKALKPGQNQLAIEAANLPGTDGGANPAGLIGRYTIECQDAPPQSGTIDTRWRVSDKQQTAWTTAGFDDSAWPMVRVVARYGDAPWGRLDGTQRPRAVSPVTADPFQGECTIPVAVDLAKNRIYLEMDDITPELVASVAINGNFAGGLIGRPLRLEVTEQLRPGMNQIRIEPFAPQGARLSVYPR